MNILEKIKLKECTGCHACFSICPKKAIEMKSNREGFLFPEVDNEKCISCNLCIKACPVIYKKNVSAENKAYGCYNLDLKKRLESASGGIFRLIAEFVINNEGYVFGAGYNDSFHLEHICVDNLDDLKKLIGTKYVQSSIGNSYIQAKNLLDSGKQVLFSGTPCQIGGLKSFLGKEYVNLLTIDLICHGVPSPMIWDEYLKSKNKEHIISIQFRDKSNGISNAPIVFYYDDESAFKEKYNDNLYLKGFIKDLYLRESCYDCHFKGVSRISDFTIGDFWGLESFDKELINDYGISVVISHNEKFNQLIKEINKSIFIKEYPVEAAYTYNPCLIKSVSKPKERNYFFQEYQKNGLEKTIIKLSKKIERKNRLNHTICSMPYRIYHKIKRSFSK